MKIILASHGKLARGMKETLEMIVGPQDNVLALSAYEEDQVDFVKVIKEQISTEKQPIVLVSDIWGGSVNNELMKLLLANPNLILVAGMNLPLVLTLATSAGEPTVEDIRVIVQDSQQNIILVNDKLAQIEEEEEV